MEFFKYYWLDVVFICIGIYLFCCSFHKIRHGDKENLFDLFKLNYKLYSITAMFLLLVFIPTCINFVYKFGTECFVVFYTNITEVDMIGFYGDVLSFIGTVSLGALALWQTHIIKKQEDKEKKEIQEKESIPTFKFSYDYKVLGNKLFIHNNGTKSFGFTLNKGFNEKNNKSFDCFLNKSKDNVVWGKNQLEIKMPLMDEDTYFSCYCTAVNLEHKKYFYNFQIQITHGTTVKISKQPHEISEDDFNKAVGDEN